jgi:predicted acetyltransferase
MVVESIKLVEPTIDLKVEFQDLGREYLDYLSQSKTTSPGRPYPYQEAIDDFSTFLRKSDDLANGINLAEGMVPMTTFWLVREDKRILGHSHLRHRLTPALEKEGGHIGYSIRPSERRKGYGTLILALTLEKAFERGIARVLVTCDTDNIPSAKIIQKNGGILENETLSDRSGKMISRYWIKRREIQ